MADHIRITRADGTWVVRAGGAVIGESNEALELREGDHPMVVYFPRGDIATAFLEPSEQRSFCPWKGNASYYSIQTKSVLIENAAWSYEAPKPEVAEIKDHLAFYATAQVTIEKL
jgi:uncharacterized protein (DUF427 family)